MEFISLGDSALVIRIKPELQAGVAGILELQRCLQSAAIPGVVECAPAYHSLGVFFDLVQATAAGAPEDDVSGWLKTQIAAIYDDASARVQKAVAYEFVEIPVCYEPAFAPDLGEIASRSGLSPDEVVRRHTSAEYLVHCIGFTPGFPYLGGLPTELATPRREAPRKEVAAGSVAIGGAQSGIYPAASPGGWNIIGRTPLRLFDPEQEPPALLRAGMAVRFRPVTRAEFDSSS